MKMTLWPAAAIGLLLLIALITDLKFRIIPNYATAGFFAAGAVFHIATAGLSGAAAAIAGAAAGLFPLLLLYFAKGIGAGDVKLFAAIGAWAGAGAVLKLMLYAILYSGLIGIVVAIVNRAFSSKLAADALAYGGMAPDSGEGKWRRWKKWTESGTTFPFMLAVAPAAITVWFILN